MALPAHRQWTPLGRALASAGDNWTLIIVAELAAGRTRLASLRERLAGVSAGVLARQLHRMERRGLLTRARFREMPPRVELELTEAGWALLPIAAALAGWGLRFAWSAPLSGEQLDVAALLRQRSVLSPEPLELELAPFTLRLTVGSPPSRSGQLLEARDGLLLAATGSSPERAAVTISGERGAWLRALGPERDTTGLALGGALPLGEQVLAAIGRSPDGCSGQA